MAQVGAPANDRKRVKVYELKNNDWFDRGTGFCRGIIQNDEAKILVASEDEPTRQLLESRITKEDGYQKQQETLIVWTEPNGIDMALSFQEAEGCAAIWDFVNEVQGRMQLNAHEDGLSDDIGESSILLPSPDLGNLPEIENHMRAASATGSGREALAKFIVSEKYIPKLLPLVEMAEDLESLPDLHRLCSIMKMLILLNDTSIIEYVVTDDVVLGVVGALEYDPDFPLHKASHRQYLADPSRFKQVVPFEDPIIKTKIHFTYRLQYLKDVVLARILDDPTYSVLNSLIFYHQVDIVNHIAANSTFLKDLFAILGSKDSDENRKKEAIMFIQQCCAIGKSIQNNQRAVLYQTLVSHGLLEVIQAALKHQDSSVRVAGADILIALIDHDALMVRSSVFKSLQEHRKPLTDTFIELFLVEVDLGVKSQMADAIKILLDPSAISASVEALSRTSSDFIPKLRSSFPSSQNENFFQKYYEDSVRKLFQPLKDLEERDSVDTLTVSEQFLYFHLVDVLCYFLRQHHYRIKYLIVSESLGARVAQLLKSRPNYLKLMALKFFRTCLGLHEESIHRQLVNQQLFEPILQIVLDTMPRDTLLNSAALEIFEFIRRDHMNQVIKHLVPTYRETLESITYVDTFQQLIRRYDQLCEPATTQELEHSFTSVDSETPARQVGVVNGGKWGQGLRELDPDEEAYFHGSDDEDETMPSGLKANGASPVRPLVNYPDDDNDDDDMDILATSTPSASPSKSLATTQTSPEPKAATTPEVTTPPERISEKRRREEDEEDELLASLSSSGTKRKAGIQKDSDSPSLQKLRRKNSMSNAKDTGAPRKISISLPVKSGGEGGGQEE